MGQLRSGLKDTPANAASHQRIPADAALSSCLTHSIGIFAGEVVTTLTIIPPRLLLHRTESGLRRRWSVLGGNMIRCRSILWIPAVLSAVFLNSVASLRAQGPDAATDPEIQGSVIPIAGRSESAPEMSVERLDEGTSARWTRKTASDELPLDQLTAESRATANEILGNVSLFRRLPKVKLQADKRVYEYFAYNPDVAVSIWRAMEISKVQLTQKTPDNYEVNTGDGTVGSVTVLYQGEGHHLILCEGEFQGPGVPRPMQARALMHLQPTFATGPEGRTEVTHTLDLFVSFPSQTVEALARLISPVSNHVADRNFEEVSLFIEMMDRAMTQQPGWVEQISTRMNQVDDDDPQQLLRLTAAVYVDGQRNPVQQAVLPMEPEQQPERRGLLKRIFR